MNDNTNKPITVCACGCGRALTAQEIKLTIEGNIIEWDGRKQMKCVTLDYCSIGKELVENSLKKSIREVVDTEEKLREIDALDKLQREMNKQNQHPVPSGLTT
jgi:hypothetical protein